MASISIVKKTIRDIHDLPSVTAAEWEVLKTLWENEPMTTRDLCAAVGQDRNWAYTTTKTVLYRLVKKGIVSSERIGGSFLHRANCGRRQLTLRETRRLVDRLLDGSMSSFLEYALGVSDLDEADISSIRQALARKRRSGDGRLGT